MKSQLFLFIAFVICGAKAANILLFPGMMAASVCNEMLGFGEELETRGHKVMFYLPDKYDYKFLAKTKIKILKYRFKDEDKKLLDSIFKSLTEKVFGKKDVSFPNISSSQVRTTVMNTICDNVFADKDALNTLKKLKLDLVVVEALPYTKCLFFLPHYLNVSYAGLAANIDGRDGGLPFQGNTYPYILSTFSDKMTFIDRFKNVMMNILQFLLRPYMLPTRDPAEYDPSLAGSDAEELMRNAVLYLENSDHVVDYPKALMPNFVQVGGLTASPAKKLPPQLEKFMSGAADGVVVVSFGSILQEAPPVMMKKLMSAFSELKQKVLFKTDSDFVKGNVKGVKWFPQNDVLGHPAVKLFISHCGKNGFFESVYHGVPVICTPLNGDGFSTASKVENKHIGISLDLNSVSSNDIVKAVDKVLSHSSYKENMKRTSLLLRDRPGTAPARAASAIEHVIKYGGDHMKSSSRHLSLMSYLYADIWFFIFSVIVTVLYILFYIVRFICCRKRQVTKKKSD